MTTLAAVAFVAAIAMAPQEPAPKPVTAEPKPTVTLQAACSDLLLEPVQALTEAFAKQAPTVRIAVRGGGSGAAMAGLSDGTLQLAFTVRPLTPEQLATIRGKGFEPIEVVFGREVLAILVHRDNAIASLTMAQLKELWADPKKTTKWAQLDVQLANGTPDIALCVPGGAGLRATFQTLVLGPRGKEDAAVRVLATEAEVREFVAATPNAIGYVRQAFVDERVRIVPIATRPDEKPALPTATDGGYSLQRPCYLYFRDDASGNAKAFAAWLRKQVGAAILAEHGLRPAIR